jgi:hypothetical protein
VKNHKIHIAYLSTIVLILFVIATSILIKQNIHNEQAKSLATYGSIAPVIEYYSPGTFGYKFVNSLTSLPEYMNEKWLFTQLRNIQSGYPTAMMFSSIKALSFDVFLFSSGIAKLSYLKISNPTFSRENDKNFNIILDKRVLDVAQALEFDSIAKSNLSKVLSKIPSFYSKLAVNNSLAAFGQLAFEYNIHNELIAISKQIIHDKNTSGYSNIPELYPIINIILSKNWGMMISPHIVGQSKNQEGYYLQITLLETSLPHMLESVNNKKSNKYTDWPTINPFNIK